MSPVHLTFLQLRPDLALLHRWALRQGLRSIAADAGYTAHAATKAALGHLAPKPFALRQQRGRVELLGYTAAAPDHVQRSAMLDSHDSEAARALGLAEMVAKPMPADWKAGERFSFEVRVAPVVRSRAAQPGQYVEIDAAFHPEYQRADGDRQAAYGQWLAAQLSRSGAAELCEWEIVQIELTDMVRRTQRDMAAARRSRPGRLPDLTVRGNLQVQRPDAFGALLARGVGRHRAFGYGCLLLAPLGAYHRAS